MLERIKVISDVIVDSYFVVDAERNILDFNRAFHSMLPRAVARGLRGKKCYDVLHLEICKERCIAQECWNMNGHIRLDEISGTVAGMSSSQRFIISAMPIHDDTGQVIGAMELQRNVTDEALVQAKYQQQVEASTRQQAELQQELQARTARLLEVSRHLIKAQREVVRLRSEMFPLAPLTRK